MASKEKGRPAEGSPIPKMVPRQGYLEFTTARLELQVSRLTRRCAVTAAMAEILAPMIFGVLS